MLMVLYRELQAVELQQVA